MKHRAPKNKKATKLAKRIIEGIQNGKYNEDIVAHMIDSIIENKNKKIE